MLDQKAILWREDFLIGHRNRVVVMFQWALAYFSFKRTARLILLERVQKDAI